MAKKEIKSGKQFWDIPTESDVDARRMGYTEFKVRLGNKTLLVQSEFTVYLKDEPLFLVRPVEKGKK